MQKQVQTGVIAVALELQTEAAALEIAMRSEKVRSALNGHPPSKVVYVKDRLINLVL